MRPAPSTGCAKLVQLGRLDEAKAMAAEFMDVSPQFSITQWAAAQPFQHEPIRQKFVEGYLKAGLPM
jgi:hypothetical protein